MKIVCILIFAALSTVGQETSETLSQAVKNEIARQVLEEKFEARHPPPNEVRSARFTCGGIAVQLVHTSQPLQLLNPAAAGRYGSAYQNVVTDASTGRATGLKVFSIKR
jgi:hypothetical protein